MINYSILKKDNKKYLVIFLFFLFSNQVLSASIRFKHIKPNQDYPNLLTRSIIQNNQGFLLLGTDAGLLKYNGYNLKPFLNKASDNNKINSVKKLFIDSREILWIGTRGEGLLRYDQEKVRVFEYELDSNNTISSNYISDIAEDSKGGLWIGTDKGLNYIDKDLRISHFPDFINNNGPSFITSILVLKTKKLLIGTKSGLLLFNIETETYNKISLKNEKNQNIPKLIIYVLHKDNAGVIWIGTQYGVYKSNNKISGYQRLNSKLINFHVLSIASGENRVWIGTMSNGLFEFSKSDKKLRNFSYNPNKKHSLSDNSILSLYMDKAGLLWVSTYYKGLNYIDTKALNFGLEGGPSSTTECYDNLLFSGFSHDDSGSLWVANRKKLIKFSQNQQCEKYILNDGSDIFKNIMLDAKNQLWFSTTKGLFTFNSKLNRLIAIDGEVKDLPILFTIDYKPDVLLLATRNGLYTYHTNNNHLAIVEVRQPQLNNIRIYDYAINSKNELYFATQVGIAKLIDGKLSIYDEVQSQLPKTEILSLFFDSLDNILVGTYQYGLYNFDHSGYLLLKNNKLGHTKNISIHSIIDDDDNNLWMGSDRGLIKYNLKNNKFHIFHQTDGLQENYFNVNAVYKAPDGKLYFGGRNGFNAFYPEDIKINETAPNIVLTDFSRFGKPLEVGVEKDGFLLTKPINELTELTLNHKDYVVGFEFSALDFADPSRNKYAYMMEGQDPDWTYVDADNRRISYSNLKVGEYTFRVKGANKDGVWNEVGKSLNIVVKPAPWFSWWAYAIYIISGYYLISWYFRNKNAEYEKLTDMLKFEVERQTTELKIQKNKVENLLVRKNELFANVSHEFRTPLTLILGPVNKLLKSHQSATDMKALKMINRNANRLLTMIEQLLQLAKISDNENISFSQLKTKIPVANIIESFKPLAAEKRIDLQLTDNDEAAINSSKDAIEIILGNLLSNAIKYTPEGGGIRVRATVNDNKFNIAVSDTGCGLDDRQQKDIFNRFKRLDTHQNIEGIGIGLSVVEELLKVNNGIIQIKSRPGEGSTFTVTFDCISLDFAETDVSSNSLLLKQLTSEPHETTIDKPQQQSQGMRHKESILIIEDNHDMRAHIADTLKDYYYYLLAEGGKEGIALAIKHVPDIIICDVMMPGMDGFHVSRVMRSDTRTSHIPLVLLTALEDRESRIRGWREHVDAYLTKPFDAQELLLQLENILVIRNILKKKAGQLVKVGQSTTNSDLPKKDQQFIDKLNELIIKKYQDPFFLRPQMASDMAVSERQLQRKLKALIDKNPMDLLREYRLSQAANMLKDGYQVSITSDNCGFNSLPHFSKCFKSQFGIAPKAYQKVCQS